LENWNPFQVLTEGTASVVMRWQAWFNPLSNNQDYLARVAQIEVDFASDCRRAELEFAKNLQQASAGFDAHVGALFANNVMPTGTSARIGGDAESYADAFIYSLAADAVKEAIKIDKGEQKPAESDSIPGWINERTTAVIQEFMALFKHVAEAQKDAKPRMMAQLPVSSAAVVRELAAAKSPHDERIAGLKRAAFGQIGRAARLAGEKLDYESINSDDPASSGGAAVTAGD
jgi:hypothetical protein